jgi:hypothetical protein
VLTKAVVTLASDYGRYGYRRITALLRYVAGTWARTGSSSSGVVRALKYLKIGVQEVGYG